MAELRRRLYEKSFNYMGLEYNKSLKRLGYFRNEKYDNLIQRKFAIKSFYSMEKFK
jgi:hypothetical protein